MPTSITELKRAVEDAQASEAAARRTFEARKGSWKDETAEKAALMRAAKARHAAERALNEETLRAEGALAARGVPVTTGSEPTYVPGGKHSFFQDIVSSQRGSSEARERLERNNAHVRETRATGDVEATGFEAPAWMAELWAKYPRPASTLQAPVPKVPLPGKGFTGSIPRITTGLTEGAQNKTSGVNDDVPSADIESTTADADLVTVAGQTDVDLQIFERTLPGADVFIYQELTSALDAEIDRQIAIGQAASAEHVGLLFASGTTSITWTESSPTPQKFLAEVAKGMNDFYSARFEYPTHIVLSPARASWLFSGTTDADAPLFANGGLTAAGQGASPSGSLLGMQVLVSGSVSTDYSDNTSRDAAVLWRPSDAAYAADRRTFTARQTLVGKLQVRLQVYEMGYFWATRIPSSVAVIRGSGMAKVLS